MGIVQTNYNEAGDVAAVGENSEEHEPRINDINGAVLLANDKSGSGSGSGSGSARRKSKQRPRGSSASWGKFLPCRSLKVLLVENDDSTRHLVRALLRNCGYEVTAVENGKQAWKVLEDLTADVDLVLSEVVLPFSSGIGLLCKIMSKKVLKNIPVIMMSSHDSRSMVFKCLSKGAVDFLVKPIRKNELKYLWQHVWRKYQISSGASGSESGIWIEKSLKSRTREDNDEDDNESIGLDFRNESDSGTQSSWTTRAVDVDSPRLMSPRDQFADSPDAACPPKPRVNNRANESERKTLVEQDSEFDKKNMGKDLRIGICGGGPSFPLELDLNNEQPDPEDTQAVIDLSRASTDGFNPHVESAPLEETTLATETDIHDDTEIPFLEVMLKRPRDDVGDARDRNVFSRYNSAWTGNVGSCSSLDNSSESTPNSNGTPPKQRPRSNTPLPSLQQNIQGESQSGSSNMLRTAVEVNASNHSLNESASGIKHKGKRHKRNNNDGASNPNDEDENRFARREAALERFRQKRQQRCFEKKVRYQSRKKLAEQRPRIRGQFIGKEMQENNKAKGIISYEPDP